MCLSALLCCHKIPEAINSVREKVYLWFQILQSMCGWLCHFGGCGEMRYQVGAGDSRNALACGRRRIIRVPPISCSTIGL